MTKLLKKMQINILFSQNSVSYQFFWILNKYIMPNFLKKLKSAIQTTVVLDGWMNESTNGQAWIYNILSAKASGLTKKCYFLVDFLRKLV